MENRIKSVFDARDSENRPSAEVIRHAVPSYGGFRAEAERTSVAAESDEFDLDDLWDNVPV